MDLEGCAMKKRELIIKSREAMLAAVQIYNNPQITFKSENYIILSIIAWTYLLHCYFANQSIDYRYWHMEGKKKVYDKTKYGAYKHWELQRCLEEKKSPIDKETTENLKFLIGLRHEVEHQMTQNIDNTVSAKIQACSINYNYYIKEMFGDEYGVDGQLGLAVQFSPIQPIQKEALQDNQKVATNICNFICSFEETLADQDVTSPRYAYRVLFTRLNAKRKGQADQVIEFLPEGTEVSENLNKTYMLIKETEKKKYLSKEIVDLMHSKGYSWFTTGSMTGLWKNELGSRNQFGLYITKSQWMWYENWIPIVEAYCKNESSRTRLLTSEDKLLYANNLVELIKQKGYSKFSTFWLVSLWKHKLKIDRNNTKYGYFNRNNRFVWSKDFIPIVENFCIEKWGNP